VNEKYKQENERSLETKCEEKNSRAFCEGRVYEVVQVNPAEVSSVWLPTQTRRLATAVVLSGQAHGLRVPWRIATHTGWESHQQNMDEARDAILVDQCGHERALSDELYRAKAVRREDGDLPCERQRWAREVVGHGPRVSRCPASLVMQRGCA